MISKEMTDALNEQLQKEFHSAYMYLGLSAYASDIGFNGCASWFNIQYQEEVAHAMKLFKYIENQDAKVDLKDIKAFNMNKGELIDIFKKAYGHEQVMTKNLNNLSDIALKEKDHATYNLLQWYVNEQVEEESMFKEIIDKLKIVGNDGVGLFTIDQDLSSRTFVDPTATA